MHRLQGLFASENGHIEASRETLLIEKGADFNKAKTDNRTTPLINASQKGTSTL